MSSSKKNKFAQRREEKREVLSHPKVAIACIAKNEEANLETFAKSFADADAIYLTDTGSTDNTVQLARDLGFHVNQAWVEPWSFAVARNLNLATIPLEYGVVLPADLDFQASSGWRQEIDSKWTKETTEGVCVVWTDTATWAKPYVFARTGYTWRYAMHEQFMPHFDTVRNQIGLNITLSHFPDETKDRKWYLDVLKRDYMENPDDLRLIHYFGRELMMQGQYLEAIEILTRHFNMCDWPEEKSASARMIAEGCRALGNDEDGEKWYLQAIATCPTLREPWVRLARLYYDQQNWVNCLGAAIKALAITQPSNYMMDTYAWNWIPHDLAAMASYCLGAWDAAISHGEDALDLAKGTLEEQKMFDNLEWYKARGQEPKVETPKSDLLLP